MFDLTGCYDLHMHTSPDVNRRKLTDAEAASQALDAGMAGIVLKNHCFPTAGRAANLKERFPAIKIFSTVVLNRQVGGMNPAAVEAAAKMGARYVFLPTMDARYYKTVMKHPHSEEGFSVFEPGSDGKVSDSLNEIIDLVNQYDLVLGTGHVGTRESMAVAETCSRRHVKRFVMTHVSLPVCRLMEDELERAAELGAYIEYSYHQVLTGKCPLDLIAEQARLLKFRRVILTTDLGQPDFPFPVEGLRDFCGSLESKGIKEEEIYRMIRETPKELIDY